MKKLHNFHFRVLRYISSIKVKMKLEIVVLALVMLWNVTSLTFYDNN
jgi:hypothetical protein